MTFFWEARFTADSGLRIETVMRQAMTQKAGGQHVYTTLRAQGLGYRKTDMLQDYRRFQAVDMAKTPEARGRAESWFEKVYQPLWKEMGRDTQKTTEFLRAVIQGTIETFAQAQLAGTYAEFYEQMA